MQEVADVFGALYADDALLRRLGERHCIEDMLLRLIAAEAADGTNEPVLPLHRFPNRPGGGRITKAILLLKLPWSTRIISSVAGPGAWPVSSAGTVVRISVSLQASTGTRL